MPGSEHPADSRTRATSPGTSPTRLPTMPTKLLFTSGIWSIWEVPGSIHLALAEMNRTTENYGGRSQPQRSPRARREHGRKPRNTPKTPKKAGGRGFRTEQVGNHPDSSKGNIEIVKSLRRCEKFDSKSPSIGAIRPSLAQADGGAVSPPDLWQVGFGETERLSLPSRRGLHQRQRENRSCWFSAISPPRRHGAVGAETRGCAKARRRHGEFGADVRLRSPSA